MDEFLAKAKAWVAANQDKAELTIAFVIGIVLGGIAF